MSKQRCLLAALLLLFMPSMVFSQQGFTPLKDPSAFKKRVAESSSKIFSIESTFIQEKNLSVLSEKIISKGKFYFRKEKSLRWEYTDPYKYLIILHDDKFLIKDEGKVSKFDVQSNKMFREINTIFLGCVQGTLLADEKRFSSTFAENNSSYLVKLKPLETPMKETLKEIWIYFGKTDLMVSKLEMHEYSEDYTNISFTVKNINQTITDDKFRIK